MIRLPVALCLALAACSEDPQYLVPPMPIEGGMLDMMGEPIAGVATMSLPITTEDADDLAARTMLATALGVAVPYVRLGDLAISVEWTLTNLDARPGKARISVNGANELFSYDSVTINAGADEDAPQAPALAGDIPIDVPASATVNGVFREDQLDEVAIDLDQITRGNINPFRATLQVHEDIEEFQPLTQFVPPRNGQPDVPQTPMGPPIPRRAIAGLVRVDLSLVSTSRMQLGYTVRVRDLRGLLHERLLAAPMAELSAFNPTVYVPPAP